MRFLIYLLLPIQLFATPLADRMLKTQPGQFVVTKQDKTLSLLLVRERSGSHIVLEEVSAPMKGISWKGFDWQAWINKGAPGHTSWVAYEMDLNGPSLIEAFSYTRSSWIFLDEEEHFLTKLLTLPLSKTATEERRRIGMAPPEGEDDHRPLWHPPRWEKGKLVKGSKSSAWQARWPKDETPLSECRVEAYFPKGESPIPFPQWIEVSNGHFTKQVQTLASGFQMHSPKAKMPRRTIEFIAAPRAVGDQFTLTINCPVYLRNFKLYLIDPTAKNTMAHKRPFTVETTKRREELIIKTPTKGLNKQLKKGHQYEWVIIPEGQEPAVEQSASFVW